MTKNQHGMELELGVGRIGRATNMRLWVDGFNVYDLQLFSLAIVRGHLISIYLLFSYLLENVLTRKTIEWILSRCLRLSNLG